MGGDRATALATRARGVLGGLKLPLQREQAIFSFLGREWRQAGGGAPGNNATGQATPISPKLEPHLARGAELWLLAFVFFLDLACI